MGSKMKRISAKCVLPNLKVKVIVSIANKSTSKILMTEKPGFSAMSVIGGCTQSVLTSIFITCIRSITKMSILSVLDAKKWARMDHKEGQTTALGGRG